MARKDRDAVSAGLGQIFGSDNNILDNVIRSDRERSGRNNLHDATSSEVAKQESSAVAHATSSPPTKKRSSAETNTTSSEVASATVPSSVEGAIFELLDKPYSLDPLKGPFTVSTLKIPTALSERLGWVSTLTGKPKQEIVAEALKLYFETLSSSRKPETKR